MKKKSFMLMALTALLFFVSCKKDTTVAPQLNFTSTVTEGTASANGEYTITGHISSASRLDKVVLTKEGQATPFLIDESTAKNKNEYDFSYLVTGIIANTYIFVDAYDQTGGKVTLRFLINK